MDILMVEDNRGDLVLIQEAMAKLGLKHRINVVCDGVEAIKYLRAQDPYADAIRPDLIVLDLKLPRKSGREVLEEINGNSEWRTIPIALISSSRSELERAKAIEIPVLRYMVKPSTFAGYVELARSLEAFYQKEEKREERKDDCK